MKWLWMLLLAFPLCAQDSPPSFNPGGYNGAVQYVQIPPSGACGYFPVLPIQMLTGVIYTCKNGVWTAQGSGGGGAVNSVFGRIGVVVATSGDYAVGQVTGAAPLASPALTGTPTAPTQGCASNTDIATGAYVAACASSGSSLLSQKVVYVSKLGSIPASTAVVPGSSASGTTDSASIINTAIAGGNVDLEVDGGYALSASLVLSSNTTIHCIAPQYGFIMQASANAPVIVNAHPNSPTTSSGTGGYLVSNQTDSNIRIAGCTLNANSLQAVTGSGGVPHQVNPATGAWVTGTFLIGVNGIVFDHDEVYDTGTFATMFSNDSNVYVTNSYIHQPTALTIGKNTDGIHFIGPDQFLFVQNNRLNCGDDCVAFNADDGNRPGAGDANYGYVSVGLWIPVKWGWITDFHEDSNTLDGSIYGGRLLSATERIDRGSITNLTGTTTDYAEYLSDPYTGLGGGDMGNITIDGFNVAVGAQSAGFGAAVRLDSSIQNLQIRGLKYYNPGSTNPVFLQAAGSAGIISIRDWDIYTQSGTVTSVVDTAGGTVTNLAASGLSWDDTSGGTGTFFAGAQVPSILTCSNYAGPNRLLPGSGYTPANENGDCFTNTYPAAATVYVNTTFNEQTAGTLLAGTAPATCANGCTGNWTAGAGGPTTGQWAYSTNSATITGFCAAGGAAIFCPVYMNVGHTSYTVRATVVTEGSFGMALRYTDGNNVIAVVTNTGNFAAYDCVSGTCSLEATEAYVGPGVYEVTLNGTSITLTSPSGSVSGVVSSSNTGNLVGINNNISAGSDTSVISAFSVKSN